MGIHPTAVVSDGAVIGEGTSVGPYCVIGPNVEIGEACDLASHVVIDGYTKIGSRNKIFPFASIGTIPQDLKYRGEPSTLSIGNENQIREYVTLQPGTEGGGMKTEIGDTNLFMANSHVGHDCIIGNRNIFANSVALAGHVHIHNNAILGGLCALHQFIRVGDFALVGGGSMVTADVPPYMISQGDRAKLRSVNVIGLKRAGFDKDEILAIRKTYRHFFSTVGQYKEKLETVPSELAEHPRVNFLMKFIGESLKDEARGLVDPAKSLSLDE